MQRESMEFDVIIVGAGPAGLAAAIRLARQSTEPPLSICVIDKGQRVGAHVLSGNVFQPTALDELIPDWAEQGAPLTTKVTEDLFYFLTRKKKYRLPTIKALHNHGNYIISLGQLCEWLSQVAENLGVNIFPGFSASEVLFDHERVIGVQTGDMGLDKNGQPTNRLTAGINLYAKQTLFAEGCRGSLTEQLIKTYELRKAQTQTYGIGLKEIWQIEPEHHHLGRVIHTMGWPLNNKAYGGGFLYHFADNKISIGLVAGLDYRNPYFDPFKEFQQLKCHPSIYPMLIKGRCLAYGARALNEGGLQAIPKLVFPGGMLIGCAAGFLNVAKIKGAHTAMKSGMLAADALLETAEPQRRDEITLYPKKLNSSFIQQELYRARNIRPGFHQGLWPGLLYAAFDQFILHGRAPWTLAYHHPDNLSLQKASECQPIIYPKPDNKVTFDRLTQVALTGVKHNELQPVHLKILDARIPIDYNFKYYAAPEQRYCPAKVYEIIQQAGKAHLQVNAANCIHCKACDIKDPKQNIKWIAPEGGDGPNYNGM